MDELQPIGDKVDEVLDGLKDTERHDPAYDQRLLEQETRRAEFNPDYMTEYDYRRQLYTTNPHTGRRQRVHDTMHFVRFFGTYDQLGSGKPPEGPLEEAYAQEALRRQYDRIFVEFQRKFPNLRLKMLEIAAEAKAEGELTRTDPQKAAELAEKPYYDARKEEREFYASCAYVDMAELARSLDPSYELEFLYQAA